jgi:3-hydroxymyristoyl/3-hydroxydecanoyl-(acyl carrier protein) dehydratase
VFDLTKPDSIFILVPLAHSPDISYALLKVRTLELDKKDISRILCRPEEDIGIDNALYDEKYPDEIKTTKLIEKDDPKLDHRYPKRPFYGGHHLFDILTVSAEILVKIKYPDFKGLPVVAKMDMRFRKMVRPEAKLLVQLKLLRNYKNKAVVFSGVIIDEHGDFVVEALLKGTPVKF